MLVVHVALVLGGGASRGVSADEVGAAMDAVLADAGLSPLSVAEVATVDAKGDEPGILEAAGATDLCINDPIPWGGWHLLGTARMGTDPARSVVNEWGRSHDVKNLFIVDGSVFVTSGGVNPTSTIQAIALYIADQMKQRLANLFD